MEKIWFIKVALIYTILVSSLSVNTTATSSERNSENLYLFFVSEDNPTDISFSELGDTSLNLSNLQITVLSTPGSAQGEYLFISVTSSVGKTYFHHILNAVDFTAGRTVLNIPSLYFKNWSGQYVPGEYRIGFVIATDTGAVTEFEDELVFNLYEGAKDSDKDGLTDEKELSIYHTDPFNSDSDGDGLTDGEEVNQYSTDPNNIDSDNDGLTDGQEINQYALDPLNKDSDGDGNNDFSDISEQQLLKNTSIKFLYWSKIGATGTHLLHALREKSNTEYYVAEYTYDEAGNTILINSSIKLKTDPSLTEIRLE